MPFGSFAASRIPIRYISIPRRRRNGYLSRTFSFYGA